MFAKFDTSYVLNIPIQQYTFELHLEFEVNRKKIQYAFQFHFNAVHFHCIWDAAQIPDCFSHPKKY